ncbi:MAG: AAA family ATPase [Firmicutes bacterium]|nr:AAA family ATPase [Bacillota bacterium]
MRPRYLEIEGLQSFKQLQKIDFDELSETGLFGIFGPTGSGKSTVLDAITLALYGKVHRANMGTQGIINTDCNRVKVTFRFDLLKDNERKTYRVERVYNRKKGSENSCEAKLARLVEECDSVEVPIADRLGDVNSKIEELLGLKHDDFTRAVVLPQNKFQEFLLMEKARKRDMLERIFYLEEYGKELNLKLSEKISATKIKLSNLEGALSALGDASEEALFKAEEEFKEAEAARERAANELKNLEKKFEEAKEVWQLVGELEFVEKKEKAHLSNLETVNRKKDLLDRSIKAEGLIDMINSYKDAVTRFEETQKQLDQVISGLPDLEKELSDAKMQLEKQRKNLEIETPRLLENKTKLINALEIKKEIEQLEHRINILHNSIEEVKRSAVLKEKEAGNIKIKITAMEEDIGKYQLTIENLKVDPEYKNEVQKAVNLENELNAAGKNIEVLRKKEYNLASKVSRLETELAEIIKNTNNAEENLKLLDAKLAEHEKAKPGEREELTQIIEQYLKLKSALNTLKSKTADINTMESRLQEKMEALGKYKENLKKTQAYKDTIKIEMEKRDEEVKNIRKRIEQDTAYILSKSLREGEPCPVCGSTHHPSPAFQSEYAEHAGSEYAVKDEKGNLKLENTLILEDMLREAEDLFSKAEAAFMEAEKRHIEISGQISNTEMQITQLKQDILAKRGELDRLIDNLPDKIRTLSVEAMEEEIEKINMQAEDKKREIDKWEKRLNAINDNIKKGKDILNGFKVSESSIKSQLQVNRETLEQTKRETEESLQIFNEKEKLYKEFLDKYNVKGASFELERISGNEREIDRLQKEIKKLQELQKTTRERLDKLQEERRQMSSQFAELDTNYKNTREIKEEKESKVRELLGESSINVLSNAGIGISEIEENIKIIENKILDMGKKEKMLSELVKSLEEQYNNRKMQKNTLENQVKIFEENLQRESQRFENALKEKGFNSIQDVEKSMLSKEAQKTLKDEIDEYEKIERNLAAQKNILLHKLGGRSITEEEWHKIEALYREKLETKDKASSQYEVAKSNFDRTREKHEEWMVLNNKNNELSRKADMLEQIKSLLRGNNFIDFVAEERLRYIAREASETLGTLTRYRYALELEPDIGFVIRDNINGGVHRMVNSLSGGETFITSLCLALALSKQIQLKGQSPLEFFFLDEGFGTLDRELLDMVIDALERLSTTERVIGVISHVPEMKQRIYRRLIVEPPTADGLGSRIRIEKA